MSTDRYAPEFIFPDYAFVPGQHPHPISDPRGHQFGRPPVLPAALDPDRPRNSEKYLEAIDLFHAGYYWEAHETWESLWVAAGRTGQSADFLKALIKLAAAGVKSREGQPTGVTRHARRAVELLQSIRQSLPAGHEIYAGLHLNELIKSVQDVAAHPVVDNAVSDAGRPVLPIRLQLVNRDDAN